MLPTYFLFASVLYLYISSALDCDINTTGGIIASIFSNTNIETLFPSWWKSSCNVCDWNNQYIVCLPDDDIIISIELQSIELSGTLDVNENTRWPSSIRLINVNNNSLSGSISWSYLPTSIEFLYLGDNHLNGSIDFNAFNQYTNLSALYLSNNQFKSPLLWNQYTSYNPSLKYLFLTNNKLYGSIDFYSMPSSLIYCFLGYNDLNGSLDFGDGYINTTDTQPILEYIEYLDVSNNKLSGNVTNLGNIPESIQYLRINSNNLNGDINDILSILSWTEITDLSLSENMLKGSINWDIFANNSRFDYLESLYIHSNQLSGNIELNMLPSTIQKFYFYDNSFDGILDLSGIPSSMQYLVGDNNKFEGKLDLKYIHNNIEYIWLFSNLFNYTNIDMDELNSTSLKELILSNNRLNNNNNNNIDFDGMSVSLPNLNRLYLDNNLFVNTDDLDFSDIPNNLIIKIDSYLSCDGAIYCSKDNDYNCSISRKENICIGPIECAKTCHCEFSINCTDYIDDQKDPETYYNNNYNINYHNNISIPSDNDINDLWLLSMINDNVLPIITTSTSTSTSTSSTTTSTTSTTTTRRPKPIIGPEKNTLEEIFGSEALAYVVFIGGFILIILLIYGVIKYVKIRGNRKMAIIHGIIDDAEEEKRRKFWAKKHEIETGKDINNADTEETGDDGLETPDGMGLATKYVTLEPILKSKPGKFEKTQSMSIGSESDGVDISNNNNNNDVDFAQNGTDQQQQQQTLSQQQMMMQMMMMNNMMMTQMAMAQMAQQPNSMNDEQDQQQQQQQQQMMLDLQQMGMAQSAMNIGNSINIQQDAMQEMGISQSAMNIGQVQSINSNQNMPILPLNNTHQLQQEQQQQQQQQQEQRGSHMANLANIATAINNNITNDAPNNNNNDNTTRTTTKTPEPVHGIHERQETTNDFPMLPDEDDDDAPIGPFAQKSIENQQQQQNENENENQHERKGTNLPNLPDDAAETNTDDENDENDGIGMFGTYKSPGDALGGDTKENVEMQQFSMAPFH